jgi:hypothetical protein
VAWKNVNNKKVMEAERWAVSKVSTVEGGTIKGQGTRMVHKGKIYDGRTLYSINLHRLRFVVQDIYGVWTRETR